MKVKHTAILAAIGIILTVFPVIFNFFVQFTKTILLYSLISIIGNILIFIFFYMFTVVQEETSRLKTAGVLGLVGYLVCIILDITGMIFNSLFSMAAEYTGLINITLTFGRTSLIISLMPALIILICFILFHKNLNNDSPLKKMAFLVIIGQMILLTTRILSLILNMLNFNILYQGAGEKGLSIIGFAGSIIGLISPVLLFIFFVGLYRELNRGENNIQLQNWLIENE